MFVGKKGPNRSVTAACPQGKAVRGLILSNRLYDDCKFHSVAAAARLLYFDQNTNLPTNVNRTRPEPARGFLWTFDTNNIAPVVDAGPDQYLWLDNAGDPSSATVSLDGTVTDDGYPNPYTILWTQLSGPPVTISPDNVEDVTIILPQAETYQFTLTANDGYLSTSDTVQIYVGNTACQAAQATPGYIPLAGDLNNDCYVSLIDLGILAGNWLGCN